MGLAFSSDHSYLASCSWMTELNIWSPTTNWSLKSHLTKSIHNNHCLCLIQLPDAQLAAGLNNKINIWSPLTKQDGPIRTLTGHSDFVISLALSPDNNILASGSRDNDVRLWKYKSESTAFMTLSGQKGWVGSVCFIFNQILASGLGSGEIKIWDISSGTQNFKTF